MSGDGPREGSSRWMVMTWLCGSVRLVAIPLPYLSWGEPGRRGQGRGSLLPHDTQGAEEVLGGVGFLLARASRAVGEQVAGDELDRHGELAPRSWVEQAPTGATFLRIIRS